MKYITNKKIVKAFKDVGLSPVLKVGDWINIARPDGVHCEFYPSSKDNYVFTGTYTVDKKEQTFDFYMPNDLDYFVETVCKILKHKKGK